MKIVPGISTQVLASRIAAELGCAVSLCEFKTFPDGELYTRVIDDVKDQEVIIVQSLMADTGLISLLQLIDAVEEAHKTTVVLPYLGYARQDKRFKPGEAISSRAIARGISFAGIVDTIYVVNVHNRGVLRYFDVTAKELNAAPLIGEYISTRGIDAPVIIGPDEGARDLAKAVAQLHDFDYDVLEKKRLSGEEVQIKPKALSVAGRNVVIVDDIISTGGTIAEAASMLRARDAQEIYVACIHGLFVQNATIRILNAGVREIIATDTVQSIFSQISVAQMIAAAVR